jgi:hypothetical protein
VASVSYRDLDTSMRCIVTSVFWLKLITCEAFFFCLISPMLVAFNTYLQSRISAHTLCVLDYCICLEVAVLSFVVAVNWFFKTSFGPFQIAFVSRGGLDLYPRTSPVPPPRE